MLCSFCSEINNLKENNFFEMYVKKEFKKNNLTNRIIAESKYFLLMPMVGPLIDNYILIVSKEHYLSFAHMPKEALQEAILIKKEIRSFFKSIGEESVFFEHGPISENERGACCSDHAHLHCLGISIDVKQDFKVKGFILKRLNNFLEISIQLEKKLPYLYYENQVGESYISDAPLVESQFIRKLFASKLKNTNQMNWYEDYNIQAMINIIKKSTLYFKSSLWK